MATGVFYLYRYQLLPIIEEPSLFHTKQEIIANKNKFFYDAILNINSFVDRKTKYKFEISKKDGDSFLLIFNKQKKVSVIKEDHTKEGITSYPFGHVFIDNDPFQQIIAAQESSDLHAKTIINNIKKYLEKNLQQYGIAFKISPMYKENDFWDYVSEHEKDISHLSFNIITPNMSNLTTRLDKDLKKTAQDTGAVETNLSFHAGKKNFLKLDRTNETIDGLVDYTSKGGGDISVKIKGLKIGFKSNDYQKSIEMDEFEYKGDLQNCKEIIRSFSNDGDHREV